jgi:hypothetical protein
VESKGVDLPVELDLENVVVVNNNQIFMRVNQVVSHMIVSWLMCYINW